MRQPTLLAVAACAIIMSAGAGGHATSASARACTAAAPDAPRTDRRDAAGQTNRLSANPQTPTRSTRLAEADPCRKL